MSTASPLRLAVDNTRSRAALEGELVAAHAQYRAACEARRRANEAVIEALVRILHASVALRRRNRCA